VTTPFIWDIRPEIFSFMPLPRWYSLIFAAGMIGGYMMMRAVFKRENKPVELLDSLLVYIVFGTMIGMRLGHCFFYQPDYYLSHPWHIPMIWEGGYASHGGFLGVIIALWLFVRKYGNMTFLWLADRIAFASMFAGGCIRVGNFFNSEMIGHPATVPWAVVFKRIDMVPRHPAQLYESVGYFAVCGLGWLAYRYTKTAALPGRLLGLIMIGGFGWRFFCEFFKEDQVAFEAGMKFNMGQLLSIPFIILGVFLVFGAFKRWQRTTAAAPSKSVAA